jgi:hypothetical protein
LELYTHPKLIAFSGTLEDMFREVDEELEELWGESFPRHPNRPARGQTYNPGMDGLFNIAPDFTAGYGSQKGRGYIISVKVATLEKVSPAEREYLMALVSGLVQRKLPRFFPDRRLEIVRDGPVFKIVGDFSLGEA